MTNNPVTPLTKDIEMNLRRLMQGLEHKDLAKYNRAMQAISNNDITEMMNISNEIRNG